jgi:hypothetical protein
MSSEDDLQLLFSGLQSVHSKGLVRIEEVYGESVRIVQRGLSGSTGRIEEVYSEEWDCFSEESGSLALAGFCSDGGSRVRIKGPTVRFEAIGSDELRGSTVRTESHSEREGGPQ